MSAAPVAETAFERVSRRLITVTGHDPGDNGTSYRCPAHGGPDGDRRPSLSVTRQDDRVLLYCHRGCSTDAVLAALDLALPDMFDAPAAKTTGSERRIERTYDYTDETGALVFQAVRYRPKDFRQRRPDGKGGWEWSLNGTRRVLYRLPELLAGIADGSRVFVVEGEKDADAVVAAGEVATCCPMGAGKWRPEFAPYFTNADVVIVADLDDPGRAHALDVYRHLQPLAASVTIACAATGKDAADHLGAGHGITDLLDITAELVGRDATPSTSQDAGDTGTAPIDTPEDPERVMLRLAVHGSPRAMDGATFLLDQAIAVHALWGDHERCLWSEGEALIIAGPDGVGKTSVAQQLALKRAGVIPGPFLGFDVRPDHRRVLYIAADRPTQAARSMRRMVTEEHRTVIRERLHVWRGPLPWDLTSNPHTLVTLAEEFGAGTIIIDSLKDVVLDLAKDETGSRYNNARQTALAEGIQLVELHHPRKASGENKKPKQLADLYGSRWIAAGAGSVLMLFGEAGDAVIELTHLKQPMEAVGPLNLLHDHQAGHTTVVAEPDVYTVIRASHRGVTVGEIACQLHGATPDRNQLEKVRRRADSLVRLGHAHRIEGRKGGVGGGEPTRYAPTTERLEEAS